jgi:acyl-CoA thioester hydrolase
MRPARDARRMSAPREPVRWPFVVEHRVPWHELDAAGHVNNAVYLSYFETARTEVYMRLRGGSRWQDLDIILARTEIDYRAPAFFHETLEIRVWPGPVGRSSFGLRYEVREKATDRLVAEGTSVQVCFDYARNEKKPVPDEVRAALVT